MSFRRLTRVAHKYGAVKVELDGRSFASKLEAAVYGILKLRVRAGEIAHIQCQDHVYLTDARILLIPDFKCTLPNGSSLYVEAKGYPTPEWNLKKKLWRFYGPAPLEIFTGSWANPKLTDIICPKEMKRIDNQHN